MSDQKAAVCFWPLSLWLLPERGVDDLVEQVVVQAGGRGETQELHGERGDEAQRDAGGTQDDEHLKIVGVLAATHNFH